MKVYQKNPRINQYGDKFWTNKYGDYHRENGLPAVEYVSGSNFWYKNGKLHRDNGLPAMEWSNGDKSWWKNGICYRRDELIDKL